MNVYLDLKAILTSLIQALLHVRTLLRILVRYDHLAILGTEKCLLRTSLRNFVTILFDESSSQFDIPWIGRNLFDDFYVIVGILNCMVASLAPERTSIR